MVNDMTVQQKLFFSISTSGYSYPHPTSLELGPGVLFEQRKVNRHDSAEALNAVVCSHFCRGCGKTMPQVAPASSGLDSKQKAERAELHPSPGEPLLTH